MVNPIFQEARIPFFQEAQESLEKLRKEGFGHPFPSSDDRRKRFKAALLNIENGNKTEAISVRLEGGVKNLFYDEDILKNKNSALEVLKILERHNSTLSEDFVFTFINWAEGSIEAHSLKVNGNPPYLKSFSPSLCEKIIKKKLTSKGIPFEISSGESDILKGLIENFSKDPTQREIACVVEVSLSASGRGRGSLHMIPLILRRTSDKIEILCTDSIGRSSEGWTGDIIQFIKEQFNSERNIPIELYTLSTLRQRDLKSCAIFAIDDICHYFSLKHKGFDLFSFVKQQIPSNHESLSNADPVKVYDFETLPPTMMTAIPAELISF